MSWQRFKAVLLQEYYITLRSVETIFDIVVVPILTVVVFGFLSLYLTANADAAVAQNVIVGMLLWQTLFIDQYSVTVPSLWNIWSRNLSMMFISPLNLKEYIGAHAVTATFKSMLFFVVSASICAWLFDYNIWQLGLLPILLVLMNLILFAISLGIILLGLVFRFGTKIQALSWGFISMLQPLSAALYPLEVIPEPFRTVARVLPATYIFEGIRGLAISPEMFYGDMFTGFLLNVGLFCVAIVLFKRLFELSKISGQFARNEG